MGSNKNSGRIQASRRKVAWILVLVYVLHPFVKINHESAFRFDVPTLKLYFYGTSIWMQDFFYVLLTFLLLTILFLLLTLLFGRVWCGWVCPQTVYSDLTAFVGKTRKKSILSKAKEHLIMMGVALVLGIVTIGYFIDIYKMIPQILHWDLGVVPSVSIGVISLLTYLNFMFVRHLFCATICPYGKIQGVLTDQKSLIIQLPSENESECMDCKACLRSCPTGLDIRDGMQTGCIMCAQCIDACRAIMDKKQKKGLIQYTFGTTGGDTNPGQLFRPTVIAMMGAIIVIGSLLSYKVISASPFSFSILPHPMDAREAKSGGVMNAYILSIKNKSRKDMNLNVGISAQDNEIPFNHSASDALNVPAGAVEKYPLFIRSKTRPLEDKKITITLYDSENKESHTEKTVYFLCPFPKTDKG